MDSYRRSLGSAGSSGTLPRSWQPVSRIPMPPTSPQPRSAPRHRPIPLSMIFKLQNAFWEHGASRAMLPGSPIFSRAPPPKLLPQPQLPPQSQPQLQPQPQVQALAAVPQPPQETWSAVSEGESAMGVPEGWVKGGQMAGDQTSLGSHHNQTPVSRHCPCREQGQMNLGICSGTRDSTVLKHGPWSQTGWLHTV